MGGTSWVVYKTSGESLFVVVMVLIVTCLGCPPRTLENITTSMRIISMTEDKAFGKHAAAILILISKSYFLSSNFLNLLLLLLLKHSKKA
jgi:hypothetical protein